MSTDTKGLRENALEALDSICADLRILLLHARIHSPDVVPPGCSPDNNDNVATLRAALEALPTDTEWDSLRWWHEAFMADAQEMRLSDAGQLVLRYLDRLVVGQDPKP